MKFREFLLKEEYQIQHRPSEPDDETPSLDKIEGSEIAPDDLFRHPEYYLNASEVTTSELKKFIDLVKKAQGKPDTKIKIYRGAPSGGKLNNGDWVTPFKSYALAYAYDNSYSDNAESKVYEYTVKASELTCDLNSLAEWGYFGRTIMGKETK